MFSKGYREQPVQSARVREAEGMIRRTWRGSHGYIYGPLPPLHRVPYPAISSGFTGGVPCPGHSGRPPELKGDTSPPLPSCTHATLSWPFAFPAGFWQDLTTDLLLPEVSGQQGGSRGYIYSCGWCGASETGYPSPSVYGVLGRDTMTGRRNVCNRLCILNRLDNC
jgi:hypothetical protein